MGVGKKVLDDVKPYMMMVLLQIGYAGMYIVSVASLKQGMSHLVLVTYRNIVATAVMTPFALIFERFRGLRPKMTMPIFVKVCSLTLLEPVIDQNLYYLGNKFTSASFSSALVNILPTVTFIMAIILRMEKLRFRSLHSQAKVAGTICTVTGTVLMIMYHGPVVQFPWAHHADPSAAAAAQSSATWLAGTVMIIACCVAWAGFFVLQSNTLNSYPAPLTLTSIICAMGAVVNAAVTLVAERRNMGACWVIGLDTRLFTVVYSGIVCSGVAFYLQGLVTKTRGPVFVTAFQPLCMLITAVMGSILLKEETTLGSVIGAAIIVLGLYSLIWGKSNDILDSKTAAENLALPLTSVVANGNSSNGGANGGRHVADR
ncbi:WAT1-related protein At1g44800-like isoform X2 [Lolium perenne]|uniref:WAT1-related protein At1g44800-like isoform X2 n=1 Tax=Lolium perenne TaxID=4522 RepID=UPI0021F5A381|nr:WAT1-related protein At1g44800-like isoform X2 [Lolium perenne]